MSYDLNFWRYKPGVTLDHQAVYERLSEGDRVEGLEDLPTDAMLAHIGEAFADWERLDAVNFDGGQRGSFQVYSTPQFVRIDCYGEMSGDDMNTFIDIAAAYGCPLYDPQVGERYDGQS